MKSYQKIRVILLILLLIPALIWSQEKTSFFTSSDSLNKARVIGVSTGVGAVYAGSMIGLSQVWYKDQAKTNFTFFNDNHHWLQMDKLGHTYTAYWIQNRVHALYRWSGVSRGNSLLISGLYSFAFQGTFELMDGFSEGYGFSYGDVLANTGGILLFTSQELLFKKQILVPKFSFYPSPYAKYRPEVLGSGIEQLLKDYNAQTYWLSVSLGDITPKNWKVPDWLCLSVGYSVREKLKSDVEYYAVQQGTEIKSFSAYREVFLSLDINLSKIPVKKPWLKALLSNFNVLKIPFPAIGFSSRGTRGYWLYY